MGVVKKKRTTKGLTPLSTYLYVQFMYTSYSVYIFTIIYKYYVQYIHKMDCVCVERMPLGHIVIDIWTGADVLLSLSPKITNISQQLNL